MEVKNVKFKSSVGIVLLLSFYFYVSITEIILLTVSVQDLWIRPYL